LAIPLGVVQRVQMGLQKGFVANLWQGSSSLLALACVILAIWMKAGLPWLVLAFAGSPLIASLLNSILYFGWQEPEAAPAFKFVSRHAVKHVAHIGISFFIMQIAGVVVFASDNIIIAQLLGAHAVAAYAIPQRLFGIIPAVLGMAVVPLWPAYGEALARGDRAWVWRTLRRSFLASVGLAGLGSIVLVCAGSWIITLWVGNVIATSMLLLVGLGIWQVLQPGISAIVMYLSGANALRFLAIVGVTTAILAIALKIYLVPVMGISGVVWASILSYVFCTCIPIYFFFRKKKWLDEPLSPGVP
jgi:O-antigen/teichoic acid export membrane protein